MYIALLCIETLERPRFVCWALSYTQIQQAHNTATRFNSYLTLLSHAHPPSDIFKVRIFCVLLPLTSKVVIEARIGIDRCVIHARIVATQEMRLHNPGSIVSIPGQCPLHLTSSPASTLFASQALRTGVLSLALSMALAKPNTSAPVRRRPPALRSRQFNSNPPTLELEHSAARGAEAAHMHKLQEIALQLQTLLLRYAYIGGALQPCCLICRLYHCRFICLFICPFICRVSAPWNNS